MKKLFILIFLLIFSISAYAENISIFKVPNSTSQFGKIKPSGTLIFDVSTREVYQLTARAESTDTLDTAEKEPFPLLNAGDDGILFGDEGVQGSYRLKKNDSNLLIERFEGNQWREKSRIVPDSFFVRDLQLQHDMTLSAAGRYVQYKSSLLPGSNGSALLVGTPYTDAGSLNPVTPVLQAKIIREIFQSDDSAVVTGTSFGYIVNEPKNTLVGGVYYKSGSTAATKPIKVRIYYGTDDTGELFYENDIDESLWVADSEIHIILDNAMGWPAGVDVYIKYTSDANFSIKTNAAQTLPWEADDYWEFTEGKVAFAQAWSEKTWTEGDVIVEDGLFHICNTTGAQATDFATNAALWDEFSTQLGGELWNRVGTDLETETPGDNIKITGNIQLGDAVIEHENETHPPIFWSGQSGLNDLLSSGTYTQAGNAIIQVKVDNIGSPNTFEWRIRVSGSWSSWTTGVPFEGLTNFILLQDGISVAGALLGHTNNDGWDINVGHEMHFSEGHHITDNLFVDGDITLAGALRSLSKVEVYDGMTIMGESAKIVTERAPLELASGSIPQITLETDGTLVANTEDYEDLVTSDDDIPNRKYVDDAVAGALGTHIVEGPADTDIIAKDPGDPTKIITIAPFKLRTVTATNGIASIKSIVSVPAGVEVTNTIPAFTGGWLGIRETTGTYEFFSKDKRDDFDLATECPIGRADRTATEISAIVSLPELGFGYAQDLYDLIAVTGLSKHISGGDLQTISGGLTLKRLEGKWWRTFANRDENQRHKMTNTAHDPVTAYEIHSASGNVEIPTEMEVGFIDDGAGGKTAIGANEWSYYLCYHWPRHTGVGYEGYQRSTRSFISLHEARALRGQGIPEMHPALDAAVLTHIIYIKGDATNLGDPEQCSIEWVRKDNISSSGDPIVGGLQQSGVIDWVGIEILTINADPTKFDRGEIRIGFVDRETGVKFVRTVSSATALTVTNLTADPFTFYGYNIDTDSFVQQSTPMERTTLNNIIPIGLIWHRNKANIDSAQTMPLVVETSHDYAGQLLAFGALKQSGINLSPNGANKKVNLSTGILEVLGGTSTSRENICNTQPSAKIPLSFTPIHRAVTTGKVVFETFTDDPDYDVYDDGSGTLQELSPNNFGIHYFYIFPYRISTDVFLVRGDQSYATLDDAKIGLQQNPIPIPSDFKSGFPFSAVIAKKGTTNLQTAITADNAVITPADRFGSFGAGGSGGGGIYSIVEDTTPQLGGNLDVLDKTIFSSTSDSITFDIDKLNIYSNDVSDIGISIWNSQGSSSGAGAKLSLISTDTNGGDPFIHFSIANVVSDWVLGIDNSDEDKMKIGASSIIGISTAITIQRDGNVGIGSTNPDNGKLVVAIPGDTDTTLIAFDEGFGGGGANNFKLIGNFNALGIANTLLLQDFNNNIDMAWTAGGNVGIGTDDPKSALHIKANTPGTIGTHPAGQLTIQSPGTSANSNAVITGYNSDVSGDPAQQLWYLGSSSSSSSAITLLNRQNASLSLGANATTHLIIQAAGNVVHNNYTKLGSDAPAIKTKKLTGTTAATEGGNANIAHGVIASKILSVDVRIEYGANNYLTTGYNHIAGYMANKQWSSTNITIYNHDTESENILSKPLVILVTYEE